MQVKVSKNLDVCVSYWIFLASLRSDFHLIYSRYYAELSLVLLSIYQGLNWCKERQKYFVRNSQKWESKYRKMSRNEWIWWFWIWFDCNKSDDGLNTIIAICCKNCGVFMLGFVVCIGSFSSYVANAKLKSSHFPLNSVVTEMIYAAKERRPSLQQSSFFRFWIDCVFCFGEFRSERRRQRARRKRGYPKPNTNP